MDFLPTEDQQTLRDGVRDLCLRRFPAERLAELAAGEPFDRTFWQELRDFGVFGLRESGLGVADLTLAVEELGRALVPGPVVPSLLAVGLVPEGSVVALLDTETPPWLVEHLAVADQVAVLSPDTVTIVAPGDVAAEPVGRPVDPLTPLHRVTRLPGGRGAAGEAEPWRREGAVLTAAYQVGIAAAVTERAVRYAGQREQFGRTIGSFQAVKHLCADMLVRTELARAAVHAAAVTLDDPSVGDVARAVAAAKVMADDAATQNARTCIQVHGGMGFTWEVDAHFYLKRAWVLATTFGAIEDHEEALAALL